jgi:hypothetical protein
MKTLELWASMPDITNYFCGRGFTAHLHKESWMKSGLFPQSKIVVTSGDWKMTEVNLYDHSYSFEPIKSA